jgi:Na+/proline symporter
MENTKYLLNGPFNLLMGLIPMTVGIIFAFGFDQMLVQRILACRDVKQGRKAMILSAILIFPQFLLFLLIGAALYAFYNLNGMNFGEIMPWDPASVNPETGIGSLNGSFVFPIFIVNHMPVVMKGFMVAAILAAAMSSVAGALSAMSSIFIMDIYRPLVGKARSGKNEIFLSRVATIISGILLAAVALAAMGSTQLISLAFTVAGLTAGGILGAFMFGLWKKKGHDLPVIVSMIVSLIFMTLFWQARVWGYAWNVNWPWHTFIGTIICFGIIWIWHLVDPDTSTRDIRRFDNEDENQPQAEEKKA